MCSYLHIYLIPSLDKSAEVLLADVKKLDLEKESLRQGPKTPRTPLHTIDSDTDTILSFLEHETDSEAPLDELEDIAPLFVHLMCSVRTKKGSFMKSIPVKNLPTCFGLYTYFNNRPNK